MFRDDISVRLRDGDGIGSYFDRAAVTRLLHDHMNGRRDRGKLLLSLYAFDVWHERFHSYLQPAYG
jgi:hypothetical protein